MTKLNPTMIGYYF